MGHNPDVKLQKNQRHAPQKTEISQKTSPPSKNKSAKKKTPSISEKLALLSRTKLYKLARKLNIPGRSKMSKTELFKALQRQAGSIKNTLKELLEEIVDPLIRPGTQDRESAPEPKASTTTRNTPAQPRKTEPHTEVWQGEPGPELPGTYNETVLRAVPKNPDTAYVYWDLDEKTRKELNQTNGKNGHTVLRVFGGTTQPNVEIEVKAEPDHCYVELQPNQTYAFELGSLNEQNQYRTVVRSKLVTMPAASPARQPRVDGEEQGGQGEYGHSGQPSSWSDAESSPSSWMNPTSSLNHY